MANNIANNGGIARDNGNVQDLAPHEIRITHLAFALDYAIRESITARLGHRIDYYVDITDPNITGWVNYTNLSFNYKF